MTSKMGRSVCLAVALIAFAAGSLPRSSSAVLDTPNTLIGIDSMVLKAGGLFRDPGSFGTANGTDGFGVFQFGSWTLNNSITTGMGKYDAFRWHISSPDACCWTNNARFNSNTPASVTGFDQNNQPTLSNIVNMDKTYLPIIDRAAFGQVFDPSQYQIQVKFKPMLAQSTATSLGVNPFPNNPSYPPIVTTPGLDTSENLAAGFSVSLEQQGGFVWDAEAGTYKRSTEQIFYNIGAPKDADYNNNGTVDAADYTIWKDHQGGNFSLQNEIAPAASTPPVPQGSQTPGVVDQEDYNAWKFRFGNDTSKSINNLYASLPKDADGFATYSVPLTKPAYVQKGFYFASGDGTFRTDNVNANGGRAQNPDSTWRDVTNGYGSDFKNFGGGPSNPADPNSKLNTPNGVSVMYLNGAAWPGSNSNGLHVEIKSIQLSKITPGALMARIDANSGISYRFGSGFLYGGSPNNTLPPINVGGVDYKPVATDQISRFDENGMTNLIFNERPLDAATAATEVDRFLVRNAPVTFDATNAVVNVRARLLQPLNTPGVAQSLTIKINDKKGNDDAAHKGADEWLYALPLNLFNTSTMTTVSIPMSSFTKNLNASTLAGNFAAPLGFANDGDGLLTNFGLYEFGGMIPAGGGLLKLEMEYMEIRLPGSGGGGFDGVTVPEPSTWVMGILGAVILGVIGRRAKSRVTLA